MKKKKKQKKRKAARPRGFGNRHLDILWAKKVKEIADHRCEICGEEKELESHHIQPRKLYSVRWNLLNGVCLCKN